MSPPSLPVTLLQSDQKVPALPAALCLTRDSQSTGTALATSRASLGVTVDVGGAAHAPSPCPVMHVDRCVWEVEQWSPKMSASRPLEPVNVLCHTAGELRLCLG